MKRTLILVGLLLALVAAWFFFFRPKGEDNVFHIKDLAEVGSIDLQKIVKGEKTEALTLSRGIDSEWRVNNKYPATEAKLEEFLTLLTAIRVQNKIDEKGQKSALGLLKRNHTQVRIRNRNGGLIKGYLIGATNNQQTSNIMMMEGANKAYLVSRPGLSGYISIFFSTNVMAWREKMLFSAKGEELKEIAVSYLEESANYTLRRSQPDAPWTLGEGVFADADRTNDYLDLFDGKVYAESFILKNPGLNDSLHRRVPDAKLSLKTLDDKSYTLLLFARPENNNNFFGYMEGQPELYTIQHFVIDKFLKRGDYFQKPAL